MSIKRLDHVERECDLCDSKVALELTRGGGGGGWGGGWWVKGRGLEHSSSYYTGAAHRGNNSTGLTVSCKINKSRLEIQQL